VRVYIGFDDTDDVDAGFGTGKLARSYEGLLPPGCRVWGVVRQQLLVDPRIPYTSHNSSACIVVDGAEPALLAGLLASAVALLEGKAAPGSDPGLCFVRADDPALPGLVEFGSRCTERIVTQEEARRAAGAVHLSGHGGTNGGIIGAAAAVGLTASGWCGRFIERGGLRELPDPVSVAELARLGIRVVSIERDAAVAGGEDLVEAHRWLRPRLWGHEAVLPVQPDGKGRWRALGEKRLKTEHDSGR